MNSSSDTGSMALDRSVEADLPGAPGPGPGTVLWLQLLGAPHWCHEGSSERHMLHWKDAALLAVLAMDGSQPRDRLATLLWPQTDLAGARGCLRQRIFRLRKTTGHELVRARDSVDLAEAIGCDLWPEQWESRRQWPEGELLPGPLPAGHEALQDWLSAARERHHQRWCGSLERASQQSESRADHEQSITLCRLWLRDQPWSEEPWCRLISALYLRGDLTAALAQRRAMQQRLFDELGSSPGAATRQLDVTLERAAAARRTVAWPVQAMPGDHGVDVVGGDVVDSGGAQPAEVARIEVALHRLSAEALTLARALAFIVHDRPATLSAADLVSHAAHVLATSSLNLAEPWRELEAQGLVQTDGLADALVRQVLVTGIPAAIADHLRDLLGSDPA